MKYDAGLLALQDGAGSQAGWANIVKTALGNSIRVRCYRDPAANAADPAATGTLFLDTAAVGGLTISGYRISSIGKASNTLTKLAATLETGTSVLRLEGNGHYVEFSLGLANSATSTREIVLSANPGPNTGISLSGISILPPPNVTSGTGYPAPALDVDAPSYGILDIGPDLNNLTEGGRIHFNTQIKNWVFEDTEVAANMGDHRVYQSTESIIYNDFECGLTMLAGDPRVGEISGKIRYDVVGCYVPLSTNWTGYPRKSGYKIGTRTVLGQTNQQYGITNTFPGPHRWRIFTADNRLLGTIDMDSDHSLINGSQLSEVPTLTKRQRMHMHCASLVSWRSHQPKISTFAKKWLCGVDAAFMRPSQMKNPANVNAQYPPFSLAQIDGVNHWYAARQWGLAADKTQIDADISARSVNDPYLFKNTTSVGPNTPTWASFYGVAAGDMASGLTYGIETLSGWGYEPGAYGCVDGSPGPGGYRPDRGAVPDVFLLEVTNPNWVHMRDNTPIATMRINWNKNYLNHPVHFVTNAKTFSSIPVDEVVALKWSVYHTYYNQDATWVDDDHTIPMWVTNNAFYYDSNQYLHGGAFVDTNGRMPFNGMGMDHFHNYQSVGTGALAYNDIVLAISAKFRWLMSILTRLNYTVEGYYMVRSHAWVFKNNVEMWKLASDHPYGVPRRVVEQHIVDDLMVIYNKIYIPLKVKNDQSMRFRTLRAFGINTTFVADPLWGWITSSFTLHYYMGHALQLWKQMGLFDVIMAKSDACRAVLLMIIEHLDRGAIDYYLDTDGCYSGPVYNAGVNLWIGDRTINSDSIELPTSWADWLARVNPKASPQEDLVHNADGSIRNVDIGEWSRMQWVHIRRDFFSDIPCSRDLNACVAKIEAWEAVYTKRVTDIIDAGGTPASQTSSDVATHPAVGRILPPPTGV